MDGNGAAYYTYIHVHGLISESFIQTLIDVRIDSAGTNADAFSNVEYPRRIPICAITWVVQGKHNKQLVLLECNIYSNVKEFLAWHQCCSSKRDQREWFFDLLLRLPDDF